MRCPSCDFCATDEDGVLTCAISGEQVHGDSTCDLWQNATNIIDGDRLRGVKRWPESKRRSRRS